MGAEDIEWKGKSDPTHAPSGADRKFWKIFLDNFLNAVSVG
jgi:hypothetical protein